MTLAKGQKISKTYFSHVLQKKRTKYLPISAAALYCKIRQLFRSFFGGYEKKLICFRDFLTFSLKFIFLNVKVNENSNQGPAGLKLC